MRYIMVASAAFAQAANRAAGRVDIAGGDATFTVPLLDDNGDVVAFWCSWDMAATGHDFQALRGSFEREGATDQERRPVARDEQPVWPRLSIFPADQWTPGAVLAELGLHRPEPA